MINLFQKGLLFKDALKRLAFKSFNCFSGKRIDFLELWKTCSANINLKQINSYFFVIAKDVDLPNFLNLKII